MLKKNAYSPLDIAIIVTPHLNKDKTWTGEVSLKISMDENNPLSEYDFEGLVDFTRQICASVPLMEENKLFRDEAERLAERYLPHDEMLNSNSLTMKNKDGNVIHVDFKKESEPNGDV